MSTNFIAPLERLASDLLDGLADVLVGRAATLRDGTEHVGVELPRDLYAHAGAQTEWWYYTGHMQTGAGRRFGFELVFFKRRTDLDRFGVVPLRLVANPLYLAHFAITDESRRFLLGRTFVHEAVRNTMRDAYAGLSKSRPELRFVYAETGWPWGGRFAPHKTGRAQRSARHRRQLQRCG